MKQEEQTSRLADPRMNFVLLPAAVLVVLGAIVGYHTQQGSALASLGILLAGIVVAMAMALLSPAGKDFVRFSRQAYQEAVLVQWPTRKETIQMTLVVFGLVFVSAIFLWLADKAFEWVLYDLFLGWRR